jgi:CubicO group peptidase (beta-lactamase class C family)
MAIERRALFALSIAFTASIVLYPDLPREMPPRAGRDGAFVGGPLVAFLFPCTAAVIWWLFARLEHGLIPASPRRRMAAATALFLSAFHVTTLIALIGAHLWLSRVLGLMVGAFLVATGNELPRLRQNAIWGIPTAQTPEREVLWRRVHRLRGYIRVAMGISVCVASVAAMPGFAAFIAIAIAIEIVTCFGAAVLIRRKAAAVAVLLMCCSAAAPRLHAQIPDTKIQNLPAFVDDIVPKLMEQGHVPGAAIAVVHDGQIVLLRGYGRSRLEDDARVDPSKTVFRIGSVSKVFTSVAALQLAETGGLDLRRDVRAYLPDVPLRYGATVHQLLTHTAGLDERVTTASSPLRVADRFRVDPPKQVIRPGTAYSYANSNFDLTGLVIEKVSGLAYEQYLADRILGPLGMTGTTALQPPEPHLAKDLARGYRWTGTAHEAVPHGFRAGSSSPSGDVSTTAADMGRFMLALLGDGSLDGRRILSRNSVTMLLGAQYTPHPRISPRGYAFLHWFTHRLRLQHHDGTPGDHIAVLVLAPDERFGVFVASNGAPGERTGIGNLLLDPMLTRLVGPKVVPAAAPSPMPDAPRHARRVAGTYRDYRHTRHDLTRLMALMPMIQSRVTVEPDGAIRWRGRRWVEMEPLVFRSTDSPDYSADGPDYIVFRENDRGDIAELHAWGATYERIGWAEQAPFNLGLFGSCVMVFLAYGASRVLRVLRRRPAPVDGRAARRCALFISVVNLLFVAGLPILFRSLVTSTPLPPVVVMSWLSLPLVSVAVTALLPGFAVLAWRERWWTRSERLGFATLAAFSVAFIAFLNYWKLLAIPY